MTLPNSIGKSLLIISAGLSLVACSRLSSDDHDHSHDARHDLPTGSNEMLRAPITIADGLEVIISDVVLPAGKGLPLHVHPGEEFAYILDGSVIFTSGNKPDQTFKAGDVGTIPPETPHSIVSGPEGMRAIVFRVHVEGQPERRLVKDQ